MNMYRVVERYENLNNININEGIVNIEYTRKKAIKDPNYDNLIDLIKYSRADINTVIYVFENCLDTLHEGQINNIKRGIRNIIEYSNNPRAIKKILEGFKERNNIDIDNLIKEADTMISADRILSNETRLDKRFNINKFIKNYNTYSENSIICLIEELCFMIDSFNCDPKIKLNTALENINYALYKNNIKIDEETIIETVCKYFELTGLEVDSILEISDVINEKTKVKVLNKLKDTSVSKVKQLINKIKSTDIKTPEEVKNVMRVMYSQSPQQIIDDVPNFLTWIRTFIMFSTIAINPYIGCIIILVDQYIAMTVKRDEADKMIAKFENEKEKCEKKLNKLTNQKAIDNLEKYIDTLEKSIEKLEDYKNSLHAEERSYEMEEMTREMKNYLDIMNEGDYGYTPYTMTPQCFYEKYCNEFTSQYNMAQNIINNFSYPSVIEENVYFESINNPKDILNYLSENGNIYMPVIKMKTSISKKYHDSILERVNNKLDKTYYRIVEENTTDDFTTIYLFTEYAITTDQEPIHKNIIEAAATINAIENSMTNILENFSIEDMMVEELDTFYSEYVTDIASIATRLESVNNRDLQEYISECKDKLYMRDKIPYSIIENCSDAMDILKYKENINSINDLLEISECVTALLELRSAVNEGKIGNNLLMAREKLRKAVVKLSDKDKEYSRKIDNHMSNMMEKIQKNLTNKNREAVIKGSILPSASAVIKLALASGSASLVNPALGVITLLGGLGAAKIGTAKEKQYILDEIEIELKIVDKKIQLAERNDDTKALEQLYRIEKQLQREKTRIKFNKKDFRPIEKDR